MPNIDTSNAEIKSDPAARSYQALFGPPLIERPPTSKGGQSHHLYDVNTPVRRRRDRTGELIEGDPAGQARTGAQPQASTATPPAWRLKARQLQPETPDPPFCLVYRANLYFHLRVVVERLKGRRALLRRLEGQR